MLSLGTHREFQSPDGDFVYSDECLTIYREVEITGFNPLTGISSILTLAIEAYGHWYWTSFNPLTGISSILTGELMGSCT